MSGRKLNVLVAAFALLVGACAPSAGAPTTNAIQSQPRAPKTLTIAQEFEPPDIEGFVSLVRPAGSGGVRDVVHNHLARKIRDGVVQPELVTQLPSIDDGTWRVNDDGSMDVTWRLRPNIRWHDGTAFTSADMLFSLEVFRDRALPPVAAAGSLRLMERAEAPDDATFVVHWSQVDATANEAAGLVPLARHLMEDSYRADKDAFVNSSRFRNDFVGLGPYRLTNWELGSHMELVRFDDYYTGRPPLDSVVVRFVQDSNTIIANLLSGTVDVAVRPQIDSSTALDLKQRWEGLGNQAWIELSGRVHYGEPQRRVEVARPRNGLTDVNVRRAFLMALDRQAISEAFTAGYAPLADSYVAPDDPLRPDVDRSIIQYPYDPAGALRLLADAGWTRGSDDVLINRETGEPFESEVWAAPEASNKQEPTLLAGQWAVVGAKLSSYVIPAARTNDRELAANSPFFTVSSGQAPSTWYTPDRLHSRFIAGPANGWGGRNKFGYINPRVDDLLDRLQVTIDPRARVDLHRQLVEEETRDLAFFPIYWEVVPIFLAKGITPAPSRPLTFAEFGAWNRE
jgi:peptide/nickel transport system substrate-binding protein